MSIFIKFLRNGNSARYENDDRTYRVDFSWDRRRGAVRAVTYRPKSRRARGNLEKEEELIINMSRHQLLPGSEFYDVDHKAIITISDLKLDGEDVYVYDMFGYPLTGDDVTVVRPVKRKSGDTVWNDFMVHNDEVVEYKKEPKFFREIYGHLLKSIIRKIDSILKLMSLVEGNMEDVVRPKFTVRNFIILPRITEISI